jgi:hypothetical protein
MRLRRAAIAAVACLVFVRPAMGQPQDSSRKWEILDNSFLIEESFNQEAGVVQNIFSWVRERGGAWDAAFTQEWPAPGMRHQLSYTVPFASVGGAIGVGDVLLNYRYQLREEENGAPAISPRVSLILPTGHSSDGPGDGTYGVQVNVPASKQFGDFYVHANAGFTWKRDLQRTPHVGGSGIWRVAPMFNLMLEALVEIDEAATVSPGFRRAWNFGDHQLVIGAAVPVTREGGETRAALLTYFSYELPFRR